MKKALLAISALSVIASAVFFKPLAVWALEHYLGDLLETPVVVRKLTLSPIGVQASITDNENIINAEVVEVYPLKVKFDFEGNADAFKVYHPLKAKASVKGELSYKDHLEVNASLEAFGGISKVGVLQGDEDWFVDLNASEINLVQVCEENNLSIAMDGRVNATLLLHTNTSLDSHLQLQSNEFSIEERRFTKVRLDLKKVEEHVQAWAIFKTADIKNQGIWLNYFMDTQRFDARADLLYKENQHNLLIDINGTHDDKTVKSSIQARVADSFLKMDDIVYTLESNALQSSFALHLLRLQNHGFLLKQLGFPLKGDFIAGGKVFYTPNKIDVSAHTKSLGGALDVHYDGNTTQWKGQGIQITKITDLLAQKPIAKGGFDLKGNYTERGLENQLSAPSIVIANEKLEKVDLKLKGPLNDLALGLSLKSAYAIVESVDVNISDFNRTLIKAKVLTPYITEPIYLSSNGQYHDEVLEGDVHAFSKSIDLNVSKVRYDQDGLYALFKSWVDPELSHIQKRLHFRGSVAYKDDVKVRVVNKDFGGKVVGTLKGERIGLKATKLQLGRLLKSLNQPVYADAKLNLDVAGDLKTQQFVLQSDALKLNPEFTDLNNTLALRVKGKLSPDKVTLWPEVEEAHLQTQGGKVDFTFDTKEMNLSLPVYVLNEDKKIPLTLKTDVNLMDDVKGSAFLKRYGDILILPAFHYQKGVFESDVDLHVVELNEYSHFLNFEMYGPLKISGDIAYRNEKPYVHLSTKTFRGLMDFNLEGDMLKLDLDHLAVARIGNLLKNREGRKRGDLSGEVNYHLKAKTGKTRLTIRDARFEGIDVDKSFREFKDMLGLNLFSIGEGYIKRGLSAAGDANISTPITQLELDLDISPDLIVTKDVAMATEELRFAINAELKHNGDIQDFEVAIVDYRGCSILTQHLKGNITDPELEGTTSTAVVVISKAPEEVWHTGQKVLDAGASILDSAASFVWQKGLRQEGDLRLVENTLSTGRNIFSQGKAIVVTGECTPFYTGSVPHPAIPVE